MLLHYIKNPKCTGAICSSSKWLSSAITNNIGIENAQNIIEVGPGLGAFTKAILCKKKDGASFFTVEINPKIAECLHNKIHNIDIQIGSAEFLPEMMAQRDMDSADVIVSGIPWALLNSREQSKILHRIYNALKKDGYFTTFAYILPTIPAKRFRKKLFNLFEDVQISNIVWQNIPPAFVYYCKK